MAGPERVQRLAADAAQAAQVRAFQTHPDVVALRVERVRVQVDRMMWAGIVLGLAFTMTNVQSFAAAGEPAWSLPWLVAWLLDPMVSLVLIAVLRAEQITARYQVPCGAWPRGAKWFTLAATYVMNTWASWSAGSPAGIVLHSVPPLVVFVAAEAVTDLRDKLTESVYRAADTAAARHPVPAADAEPAATPIPAGVQGLAVHGVAPGSAAEYPTGATAGVYRGVHEPATGAAGERPGRASGEHRGADRRTGRKSAGKAAAAPGRRLLFADYLAAARAAWTPGVMVSPAWVRQVTGCSRGLSPRVAAALRAEHDQQQHRTTGQDSSTERREPEGRAA